MSELSITCDLCNRVAELVEKDKRGNLYVCRGCNKNIFVPKRKNHKTPKIRVD